LTENRGEKKIPFQDSQIDAGNGSSVYGSGEQVNVCQQFIEVMSAIVASHSQSTP
jgi:hypothetical protein